MKIDKKENKTTKDKLLSINDNMDILRLLDDWSWSDNTIRIKKLIEKENV